MKLGFIACLVWMSVCTLAQAQDLTPGYYVVVASYQTGQEDYAKRFSDKLNQEGRHTAFGFDPTRKFFHVYLDRYIEFNESIQQMLKARQDGFPTAWVRIMKGVPASTPATKTPEEKKAVVATPVATQSPTMSAAPAVSTQEQNIPPSDPANADNKTPEQTKETATSNLVLVEAPAKETLPAVAPADRVYHPRNLTESTVQLVLYNPTNNEQVEGEVEIVDADRAKLLAKAKGNDFVKLPDPKNNTGKLTLISSSFGYRPVQHEVNYKSSEKDTLQNFVDVVENHYRIKFDMVRLRKGDIAVLYNVYFYNDAAIMLPESKYELGKLLKMMNDNPGARIKLHGHTNGNAHGKIITMKVGSKDFFTLTSDAKTGLGSAKQLSRDRAEVIKDWLVANGVDATRLEVQAHGGTRMIHDKNSANAKRNVRVEVEMLHD